MIEGLLNTGVAFPLVMEPEGADRDRPAALASWLGDHADSLRQRLAEHPAILFRGFGVRDVEQFDSCVRSASASRQAYVHGNSPRTKLADGVYTSTEYPAKLPITLHNELSYRASWPAVLFFACLVAPETGGETPLVDSRELLAALPADLVDRFTRLGVRYVQNLHGGAGLGKSWQDTFETRDRSEVERFLASEDGDYQWLPNGT